MTIRALATFLAFSVLMLGPTSQASAQNSQEELGELADQLSQGGYILVMRPAHSPRTPPNMDQAAEGNVALQRQLDEGGVLTARAMGGAIRELEIPFSDIYTSATFRARQTIREAGLSGDAMEQLGSDTRMEETSDPAWLQQKLQEAAPETSNILIVTHPSLVKAALDDQLPELRYGDALVIDPEAAQGEQILARIAIEDWPEMVTAANQ